MFKYFPYFLVSCTSIIALFLLFYPMQQFAISATLAIVIMTIGLWASGLIAEAITTLLFFAVIIIFHLAPSGIVFSGFTSSGFWLIFSGLIFGEAIVQSGLGERISLFLFKLPRHSYALIITNIVILGIGMAFIMPSAMGRAVLMTPISISFAKRVGYLKGTQGYIGIVLAGIFGSYFAGSAILPSNIPNNILVGAMESVYHTIPTYGQYFLLHFPILGLIKSLLLIFVIVRLFPGEDINVGEDSDCKICSVARNEKILAGYIILTIFFWMTDSVHHLSPAWVGLVISVMCLCPIIGVINGKQFLQKVNFSPLLFVAGIIGLSSIISYTGIDGILARKILAYLPLNVGNNIENFSLLSLLSTGVGLVTTSPGVPAVLTPLAKEISHASGMSINSVLMLQVLGFSTFLLPYQAPPIIVAAQLGNIKLRDLTKLCLVTAALSMFLLFPLDYFWWHILGVI